MRKTLPRISLELCSITQPNGFVTTLLADPAAEADRARVAPPRETRTFHYDRQGRLRRMVTADGRVTTWTWRRLRRRIDIEAALNGRWLTEVKSFISTDRQPTNQLQGGLRQPRPAIAGDHEGHWVRGDFTYGGGCSGLPEVRGDRFCEGHSATCLEPAGSSPVRHVYHTSYPIYHATNGEPPSLEERAEPCLPPT